MTTPKIVSKAAFARGRTPGSSVSLIMGAGGDGALYDCTLPFLSLKRQGVFRYPIPRNSMLYINIPGGINVIFEQIGGIMRWHLRRFQLMRWCHGMIVIFEQIGGINVIIFEERHFLDGVAFSLEK
jgi:hypothetical protein